MADTAREPLIELDEYGVSLLRAWAGSCKEFRATQQQDGSIILRPISEHDAQLWRAGLVDAIVDSFSRPDRMIRVKAGNL
jgi:hypothetical protein